MRFLCHGYYPFCADSDGNFARGSKSEFQYRFCPSTPRRRRPTEFDVDITRASTTILFTDVIVGPARKVISIITAVDVTRDMNKSFCNNTAGFYRTLFEKVTTRANENPS